MTYFYLDTARISSLILFSVLFLTVILLILYPLSRLSPGLEKLFSYECGFHPYRNKLILKLKKYFFPERINLILSSRTTYFTNSFKSFFNLLLHLALDPYFTSNGFLLAFYFFVPQRFTLFTSTQIKNLFQKTKKHANFCFCCNNLFLFFVACTLGC